MFIAVALAAFTLTAPAPRGDAPVPPPEEQVLARREFDAALTANGIDPATAYAVACTSRYSTMPNDPTTPVVSSFCWGLIGTPALDPSQPPPEHYASNTYHQGDGVVVTFLYKHPTTEMVGNPIPGEPTPPITFPSQPTATTATATPTTAAGTPTTAAGVSDPLIATLRHIAQDEHGVTITDEQANCMIDRAESTGVDLISASPDIIAGLLLDCGAVAG
jgi:hypothetical protein